MINQFETLPTDSPALMIIFWVVSFVLCYILLDFKLITRKRGLILYSFTVFFAGILLGGIPNVVLPYEYSLTVIGTNDDLVKIFTPISIFFIIAGSSLVVGRIFCGFICPLGALQELLSKIQFTSDHQQLKENKFRVNFSPKYSSHFRWIVFFGLILVSFFGIIILPSFNPFSGFTFRFLIPTICLFIISLVSILVYRPWCRFLCPFSPVSAICGKYATIKYRRTKDCTDCGLCEEVCPTQEAYRESKKAECYYCNRCIEICPHDAIAFDIVQ